MAGIVAIHSAHGQKGVMRTLNKLPGAGKPRCRAYQSQDQENACRAFFLHSRPVDMNMLLICIQCTERKKMNQVDCIFFPAQAAMAHCSRNGGQIVIKKQETKRTAFLVTKQAVLFLIFYLLGYLHALVENTGRSLITLLISTMFCT